MFVFLDLIKSKKSNVKTEDCTIKTALKFQRQQSYEKSRKSEEENEFIKPNKNYFFCYALFMNEGKTFSCLFCEN